MRTRRSEIKQQIKEIFSDCNGNDQVSCIDDRYSDTGDIYTVNQMIDAMTDLCYANGYDIPDRESFEIKK